ncbi:MAG: hypothetical protein AAFR47_05905 [Pseudomonadota bacterium]
MIFAFGRLMLLLLIASSVVYVCLWFYARAIQSEKLAAAWEDEGRPGSKESFIAKGLESERYALRRRLLLWVYAVPFVAVALIVYVSNYS